MGSQVFVEILLLAEHIFSALDRPQSASSDISGILDISHFVTSTTGGEIEKSKMPP